MFQDRGVEYYSFRTVLQNVPECPSRSLASDRYVTLLLDKSVKTETFRQPGVQGAINLLIRRNPAGFRPILENHRL